MHHHPCAVRRWGWRSCCRAVLLLLLSGPPSACCAAGTAPRALSMRVGGLPGGRVCALAAWGSVRVPQNALAAVLPQMGLALGCCCWLS